MESLSIRGLVLQIYRVKDKDCYLHLLTPDYGCISIFANRLLQLGHPCHSLAQPFSLVQVLVSEGMQSYRLLEGESVAQFPHLHQEISLQSWAAQITEFVQDLCMDAQDAPSLYPLLVHAYYALDQEILPGSQIWSLTQLCGLAHCGFPIAEEAWIPYGSGFRLQTLQQGKAQYRQFDLSRGAYAAVRFAQSAEPKQLFCVQMDLGVEQQLSEFAQAYTQICLDREYSRRSYVEALDATTKWAQEMVRGRGGREKCEDSEPDERLRGDY